MRKILLVEDNQEISKMEQTLLIKNNYEVNLAFSGTEALLLLKMEQYDMLLLDLMLPGMSGEEVMEQVRKFSMIPILCISAKDDMKTKVDIIRMGADDYITKPFNNAELLVRMEALFRRSGKNYLVECSQLKFKNIIVDEENYTVRVSGYIVELTQKEYAILVLLMSNPNKVFTKDNIYESVWNAEYLPEDNAVNVHVSNLRNKLGIVGSRQSYIKTVWGIGYKMQED